MDGEEGDTDVIGQCLRAAVEGPFFPDWEFPILFGFDRDEVRRIAERWPSWDDQVEQARAVDAALNNLLSYPHDRWDIWHEYIVPVPSEVARVYAKRRGEDELDASGRGYFDRLT